MGRERSVDTFLYIFARRPRHAITKNANIKIDIYKLKMSFLEDENMRLKGKYWWKLPFNSMESDGKWM